MICTKKELIASLRKNRGKMSRVAEEFNISYAAVYERIHHPSNPELLEEIHNIEEKILDMAEIKLEDNIMKGDLGSVCFFLKCKGKKRGYVEKQEVDMSHRLESNLNFENMTDKEVQTLTKLMKKAGAQPLEE